MLLCYFAVVCFCLFAIQIALAVADVLLLLRDFDIMILKENFSIEDLQEWGFEDFELGIDDFVLEDAKGEKTAKSDEIKAVEDEKITVTIGKNENLIYIGVAVDNERSLGWEELQDIKDKYYPNEEFIEVYPKREQIVNKANERHLFCVFGGFVPDLSIKEQVMEIKHYEL